MRKLIEAYCKRQGLQSSSVRFLFDGEPLTAEDTPDKQEMEDGDAIDVMHQQTGGH
jgi:small ubiquitin-related modifier